MIRLSCRRASPLHRCYLPPTPAKPLWKQRVLVSYTTASNTLTDMTVTVHHLNNSRSQRILWLLEELDVPYKIEHYARLPTKRAEEKLKEVHPLGKSPVITDDDGGLVLAESGAIIEYIIKKYGNGRAVVADPANQVKDTFWSHFAEGSVMPMMVNKLIFGLVPPQAPFLIRPLVSSIFGGLTQKLVDPEIQKNFDYIGKEMEKMPANQQAGGIRWLAGGDKTGGPTAADYQMLFPFEVATASDRVSNCPEVVKDWVKLVHQRPAYKRALEKGGEYAYASG